MAFYIAVGCLVHLKHNYCIDAATLGLYRSLIANPCTVTTLA